MIVEPSPIAIRMDAYSNNVNLGFLFGSPSTTFPYLEKEKNNPAPTRIIVYHIYPHLKLATILLNISFITSRDALSFNENGILIAIIMIKAGRKIGRAHV